MLILGLGVDAQVNSDKVGSWYMYFWNTTFKSSQWGLQGDIQFRNYNLGTDLDQLLIRGGLTYQVKGENTKFTLGYAHISQGIYGELTKPLTDESRVYQEVLLTQKILNKFLHLSHRFRYEQRWIDGQEFRTRLRYFLSANVPLNSTEMAKGTLYLSTYNEVFINNQRSIGGGKTVQFFDRNRYYIGLGYQISPKIRVQLGVMSQRVNDFAKKQIQIGLHQTI